MSKQVARLVASSFGLVAFALAVAVGLSVGNPADAILSRALVALIAATVGGYLIGLVVDYLARVTTAKLEREADAAIAEEEAALYAALHPERSAHAAPAGGAKGHDGAHASSVSAHPESSKSKTPTGGAATPASPQPVVAGAAAR